MRISYVNLKYRIMFIKDVMLIGYLLEMEKINFTSIQIIQSKNSRS